MPFLLALLLAGCSPSPQAVAENKPSGVPPITAPKPVPESTKAPEEDPAEKPTETASQKAKPGYIDERIHQLYDLATTTVTIGKNRFKSWVMDDDSKRTEGLMFVRSKDITDSQAMLFVFPEEADRSFWMHNTLIDLDIAYISKNGEVVSVHQMKALDETGVPSGKPAMFALEVKGGVFKKLGVRAGMKATITPMPIGR